MSQENKRIIPLNKEEEREVNETMDWIIEKGLNDDAVLLYLKNTIKLNSIYINKLFQIFSI